MQNVNKNSKYLIKSNASKSQWNGIFRVLKNKTKKPVDLNFVSRETFINEAC